MISDVLVCMQHSRATTSHSQPKHRKNPKNSKRYFTRSFYCFMLFSFCSPPSLLFFILRAEQKKHVEASIINVYHEGEAKAKKRSLRLVEGGERGSREFYAFFFFLDCGLPSTSTSRSFVDGISSFSAFHRQKSISIYQKELEKMKLDFDMWLGSLELNLSLMNC